MPTDDGWLTEEEVDAVLAIANRSDYEPRHGTEKPERVPLDLVSLILAGVCLLLLVALVAAA